MAASGSCRRRSPWPDLPAELLGLVLLRLPSHADRVRLPAVCRAWRSGARLQHPLPPPLPWLALPDGTFVSLPDGAVHRLPVIPDDVYYGVSTGGALFLVHDDGRFSLTSPFSAATVTLPEPPFWLSTDKISKAVVSDHLVAVLRDSRVSVYTRGGGGGGDLPAGASITCMEWAPPAHNSIADIALFQGKLYVLTREEELHVLDAGGQQITSFCCIRKIPTPGHDYHVLDHILKWNDDDYVSRDYLVASGDQLLRVKRMIRMPSIYKTWTGDTGIDLQRTYRFDVFEASDLSCGRGRWRDVSTLMGRALFLSQGCSQSVPATAGTGIRQDCIYFLTKDGIISISNRDWIMKWTRENPLLDSVYNMRDQTVAPLPLEKSAVSMLGTHDGMWPPAWLFPKT